MFGSVGGQERSIRAKPQVGWATPVLAARATEPLGWAYRIRLEAQEIIAEKATARVTVGVETGLKVKAPDIVVELDIDSCDVRVALW